MDRIDEIKECRKTTFAVIGHEPEIRVPVDLFDWTVARLESTTEELARVREEAGKCAAHCVGPYACPVIEPPTD